MARGTRRRLKQKDNRVDPKQLKHAIKEVLDIEVTPGSIDRATSIASAVLIALEKLGATVLVDRDKGRTVLALMNTHLGLKISEHSRGPTTKRPQRNSGRWSDIAPTSVGVLALWNTPTSRGTTTRPRGY